MRKQYCQLLLMLTLSCACDPDAGSTAPPNGGGKRPTEQIDDKKLDSSVYDYVVDSQVKYLSSCVADNGMIDFRPDHGRYNPYFSAYAALGLLTKPTPANISLVKGYLEWIFSHLNGSKNPKTGASEIPGSIYDYSLQGGVETTSGKYDSIDSYASLVLMVCDKMLQVEPSTKLWLQSKKDKIALVASALIAVIDSPSVSVPGVMCKDDNDYLSIAHLGYDVKYLMDNCEVYRGLCCAASLKTNNLLEDNVDYETYAQKNRSSIDSQMWKGNMYSYFDDNSSKCNSKWTVFYADAVAQLTPIAMGVIDPSSERAKNLYDEFNNHYTSWYKGVTVGDYPWVFVCYAAACMGDSSRVNTYIEHIYSINVGGNQKSEWFNEESGFMLMAIDKIRNK